MLKRKSKRVLSIVLAVAMIVGLFPIAAFADDGEPTTPADQNTETVATELPGADTNGVITLTQDVDISTSGYTVSGNITIDLAGYDLKVANTATGRILIPSGASLTLKDSSTDKKGRVYTESDYSTNASSGMIYVLGGTFTMESGNVYAVRPDAGNKGQFAIGVFAGGTVIINGGTVEAGWYAISGNGTEQSTSTTITINGGKLVSTADYALYLPQNGITTINDGTVTGAAGGIAQRAGKLIINGGTIASQGTGDTGDWSDGTSGMENAAVSVGGSDNKLYNNATVSIKGGNFQVAQNTVEVMISATADKYSADIAITGGTFADDVSEYVPTGYECVQDGQTYKVQTASNLEADATVSGDSANATVGGNFSGNETDEDNVATVDGTLTIDAAADNSDVTTSNVTIAPEALTSVNTATSVQNVAIKTDVATVTVDSAAWNAMTTNAENESVTLSVEKKAATDSAPLTYTLKATNASGDEVYSASNAAGAITISVPYTGTNPQVFYVGDNGLEKMNATLENKVLSWVANHFSDYVVLSDGAVATVKTDSGVTEYDSLQNAITAAKDNGAVTLVNNVNLTDGVEVKDGSTVTLDLNGYTITDKAWAPKDSADYLLAVKRGGNLKINDSSANKTGAITTTNEKIYVAVKLTIKGESTEENAEAATLTVNGGTLKAPFYGVSGNGTRHNTKLTINGGTIEGTKGTGIYQPQDGTVTINGGTITGLTGIEIRSGQLDVNGGTFISTADKYEEAENGGGTTVTGAAIAVSQHTTDKKITVTVDGGTFEGPKSFVETDVQKAPVTGSSATINNGTFVGEVSSADFTNIVKGGQFSAPVVTNLLDDTLTAQLQSTSNTTAPYSYYTSVQAAVNAAAAGDAITVLVNTDENVVVSKPVTIVAANGVTQTGTISAGNGYDVTVDENGNIVIVKEPEYNGKYSYEIFTKVGENGTISVDRYATEGDDVTITVSPDEAYLLDELTVTANGKEVEVKDNGDGTYTFKMPSADAKIVVTFAEDPDWEPEPEEPAMPFTDVNENDWFYDVVLYAYDNGLMTGVSATEFAPNQTTTRGMIVSMLARLEGVTSAEDAGFADVAANDWYATAVNWAASVGVVNGYEDNTFRPNAAITREQMAAILYNYADYKGYDVSARADLSDYADAASISSWAEDVLAWANAEGLINGMTATTIDPQGATTRAQTAAMFERFLTAHEA